MHLDTPHCHINLAEAASILAAAEKQLQSWRKSGEACFFDLPRLQGLLEGIDEKARKIRGCFDNFVALGIGGSALGLKAIAHALLPPFTLRKPRLFVCDNIDPDTFVPLLDSLDLSKTCFNVISKSGSTTETAAQFFIVLERLRRELPTTWREHLVITTDPEAGELRPFAAREGIVSFPIPPKLGGRFSVLSPVGLFPAACVGIDVKAMLRGADRAAQDHLAQVSASIPSRFAALHFLLDTKAKKNISVLFPYSDRLSLFADWFVQLWAESLGKEGKGLTPLKAVGSTDQHSQLQLFMEGPNDKLITFLRIEQFNADCAGTTINTPSEAFSYLKGHDLGTILKTQQQATAEALAQQGRPNMTLTLPKLDAASLGELFMTFEIATALTGALYGINPFDQPGVELSKKLTRERLETC